MCKNHPAPRPSQNVFFNLKRRSYRCAECSKYKRSLQRVLALRQQEPIRGRLQELPARGLTYLVIAGAPGRNHPCLPLIERRTLKKR